jgi:hypothetical protein
MHRYSTLSITVLDEWPDQGRMSCGSWIFGESSLITRNWTSIGKLKDMDKTRSRQVSGDGWSIHKLAQETDGARKKKLSSKSMGNVEEGSEQNAFGVILSQDNG